MCNDLCEKCGIGIEEAPGGCIRIGCPLKCKTAVQGWISVKERLPKLGESVGYTYVGIIMFALLGYRYDNAFLYHIAAGFALGSFCWYHYLLWFKK